MREQIQGWLKQWFVSRSKILQQTNQPFSDTDYFEAGWLTSMEVVEFVTEIERQFAMQFSDRELQDPRFVTIAGLTEIILNHSIQASESK